MDRAQKEAAVAELTTELTGADAVLAIDYRGISVPQAAELRTELRNAETSFRVVKNRLTLLAADAAGVEGIKDYLSGPTALALVHGDVAAAAKALSKLGSEWELLEFKGGLMNGEALDAESFKAIAKLPTREVMIGQFAGIVASPITGLVRGLGSMVQGLAIQLNQIAEQGLVSGEPPAPAPAEEAPAEEAPAEDTPADDKAPADEAPAADTSPEDEAPAEEPAADSDPDPAPEDSPEEAPSEEEAPAEEAPDLVESAGEGDADLGEEPAAADEADEAEAETTSEDSEQQKEDGE